MNEELPCGCIVTDEYGGSEYIDRPTLKLVMCTDHEHGYLYVGEDERVFNAEW